MKRRLSRLITLTAVCLGFLVALPASAVEMECWTTYAVMQPDGDWARVETLDNVLMGACDSQSECDTRGEQLCENAGHHNHDEHAELVEGQSCTMCCRRDIAGTCTAYAVITCRPASIPIEIFDHVYAVSWRDVMRLMGLTDGPDPVEECVYSWYETHVDDPEPVGLSDVIAAGDRCKRRVRPTTITDDISPLSGF